MNKFTRIGLFVAVFTAMASYGGTALTYAQTAPSTNTASLQQQLDLAKAELSNLEMQAGMIPNGDGGTALAATSIMSDSGTAATPATSNASLSAADRTEINTALGALANLLVSLQTKIANDPQFLKNNETEVAQSLQVMANTIALIGKSLPTQSAAVAMTPETQGATPSNSGVTALTAPTTVPAPTAATAPSAPSNQTAPTGAVENTVATQPAETASAFSFSKLNWPLIIVILLIIAAIAIWLFWDDGEDVKPAVRTVSNPSKPPVTAMNNAVQIHSSVSTQTPMSAAMNQQQKKTA